MIDSNPDWCVNKATGGRRTVGLVVDLSFSERYYDPSEFVQQGVHYAKVRGGGWAERGLAWSVSTITCSPRQ